jgi:hypothetical protein
MQGGLTMAIFRAKTEYDIAQEIKEFGAEQKNRQQVKVVDFSYESEALAQMIVDAWTKDGFEKELLKKENAVRMLADRGIFLSKAHVITEADYNKGHVCDDPEEIVFVLPNKDRVRTVQGKNLLETAKLLMAITPNGI